MFWPTDPCVIYINYTIGAYILYIIYVIYQLYTSFIYIGIPTLHVYHIVLFKSRARHSLGPRMFLTDSLATDSLATNVLHRILTSVIRLLPPYVAKYYSTRMVFELDIAIYILEMQDRELRNCLSLLRIVEK